MKKPLPYHLRPGAPQRRVVCSANRHRISGVIVCGARHYDDLIMRKVMRALGGFPYWNNCDQGFIDQWGTYMDRTEAMQVALAAGQVHRRSRDTVTDVGPDANDPELYSEDLY